jgi:hypothetical protein
MASYHLFWHSGKILHWDTGWDGRRWSSAARKSFHLWGRDTDSGTCPPLEDTVRLPCKDSEDKDSFDGRIVRRRIRSDSGMTHSGKHEPIEELNCPFLYREFKERFIIVRVWIVIIWCLLIFKEICKKYSILNIEEILPEQMKVSWRLCLPILRFPSFSWQRLGSNIYHRSDTDSTRSRDRSCKQFPSLWKPSRDRPKFLGDNSGCQILGGRRCFLGRPKNIRLFHHRRLDWEVPTIWKNEIELSNNLVLTPKTKIIKKPLY